MTTTDLLVQAVAVAFETTSSLDLDIRERDEVDRVAEVAVAVLVPLIRARVAEEITALTATHVEHLDDISFRAGLLYTARVVTEGGTDRG